MDEAGRPRGLFAALGSSHHRSELAGIALSPHPAIPMVWAVPAPLPTRAPRALVLVGLQLVLAQGSVPPQSQAAAQPGAAGVTAKKEP